VPTEVYSLVLAAQPSKLEPLQRKGVLTISTPFFNGKIFFVYTYNIYPRADALLSADVRKSQGQSFLNFTVKTVAYHELHFHIAALQEIHRFVPLVFPLW